MKTTNNLGLKKIELIDSPPDITVQDANWDLIDKHLNTAIKYPKATGTGTAITVPELTLSDGYCKTFIAAVNNNGSATTINGKKVFMPGTSNPPKIHAGKAVTIWYDAAGDSGKGCFFIKASAEGTAKAESVLAGETFSNDDDTGLMGTYTPLNDVDTKTGRVIQSTKANDSVAFLTIEGESYQKVTNQGKNILPRTNNPAKTTSGITFTPNADGSITINGTNTFSAGVSFQIFGDMSTGPTVFIMKSGITYTGKKTGSADVTLTINAKWNPIVITDVNDQTVTPGTDTQIIGAYLMVMAGATINNLTVYPQLEVGSISTTYEAFTPDSPSPQYPSPIVNAKNFDVIVHGKNTFDVNMPYTKSSDITLVAITGKEIKVTSNNTSAYSSIKFTLDHNKYRGKTWTFSLESFNSSLSGVSATIQYLYVSGGQTYYRAFTGGKDTANIPADTTKMEMMIQVNNVAMPPNTPSTVTISGVQIEVGDKQTAYEAYKGLYKITIPQELAKLPNGVKDTLESTAPYATGKYTKRVKVNTYTGIADEAWVLSAVLTNVIRFRVFITNARSKPNISVMCNRFTSAVDYNLDSEHIYSSDDSIWLYINKSRLVTQDVEGLKAWIAANPLTVQYELATPIESIVDMEFLRTFDGITTIITTADPQPNMIAVFKSALANYKRMDATTNAIDGDVLEGKTVITGGKNVKGIIINRTGTVLNASDKEALDDGTLRIIPQKGYYDGVTAKSYLYDPNYKAENFLSTKTVFGLQGAIPDRTGQVVGAEYVESPAGTATIRITPQKGYYDGVTAKSYVYDTNYKPANVKKGVPLFNGTLIGTLETARHTFPLSIQEAQPTPVDWGHIWIKSNKGASFNLIKILDAVVAGYGDGTLMLVTSDLSGSTYNIDEPKTLTDGSSKQMSLGFYNSSEQDWQVYWKDGSNYERRKRPRVYSKLGGVLDVETAYMWDSTKWALLTQKGSYIAFNSSIRNLTGDTVGSTVATLEADGYLSGDGTYCLTLGSSPKVRKRSGDVFSNYFTCPTTYTYNSNSYTIYPNAWKLSKDGKTLVGFGYYNNHLTTVIVFYTDNGSGFAVSSVVPVTSPNGLDFSFSSVSDTGDVVSFKAKYNTDPYAYEVYLAFKSGHIVNAGLPNVVGALPFTNTGSELILRNNKLYFVGTITNSQGGSPNHRVLIYDINTANRTVTLSTSIAIPQQTIMPFYSVVSSNGLILYGTKSLQAFYNGEFYTVVNNLSITNVGSPPAINLDGSRAYIVADNKLNILSVSINTSNKTVTLNPITNVPFSGGNGMASVCPW